MDRLARLRAPLAVAALAALTLVALARVGLGLSELGPDGSRAVAAARLAPNASDGSLTVLVAVLVASCFVGPAVPARRPLAAWGCALTLVSLVATVVALALTSVEVAGWSLVGLVPEVAVPAVVGVALLALARRPATAGAAAALGPAAGEAAPEETVPEESAAEETDPELQPGWAQDAAAGAVWRTAGEAARGAPSSGWDASQGWGRPPELPAAADDPADR